MLITAAIILASTSFVANVVLIICINLQSERMDIISARIDHLVLEEIKRGFE